MKKSGKSDDSAMKKVSSPLSSSPAAAGGQGHHRFSLAMSSSPSSSASSTSRTHKSDDPAKILKLIDENVIGKGAVFLGPYGRRKGESRLHLKRPVIRPQIDILP